MTRHGRNLPPSGGGGSQTVGLGSPLTPAEHQALPWAIARQPLWGIGGWVAALDDQDTARAHARATSPAIGRAPKLVTDFCAWQTRPT